MRNELQWECKGPGFWEAGPYIARRPGNSHNMWELRRGDEPLYTGLRSLEECKAAAQSYEDRLHPATIEDYPLADVTRVEVIDHRPNAPFRGRAYVGYDVARTVLSFQDDNKTLKVVLA